MRTFTVKINERTKAGKAFMAMSESFLAGVNGVEITETDSKRIKEEKNIYSAAFVEKVRKAEENIKKGEYTTMNPDDIWGSLGL